LGTKDSANDINWTVCNKSGESNISIAFAYYTGTTWKQQGWYHIKNNECLLLAQHIKSPNLYYYAAGKNSAWKGKFNVCVDLKAFEYTGEKCPQGYETYPFKAIKATQYGDFTTTLSRQ
jgi:uncharacterized membrane protein